MNVFSHDKFVALAGNDGWAACKLFNAAMREYKTDAETQKAVIEAVVEAAPAMKNKAAQSQLSADALAVCLVNLDQAFENRRESGAFFWVSAMQKLAIQNDERNRKYRQHLLSRFKKIHEMLPNVARHIRYNEMAIMFGDDKVEAIKMFGKTEAVLFPPKPEPVRPGVPAAALATREPA